MQWCDDHVVDSVKTSTRNSYELIIRQHLKTNFGHFKLKDLKSSEVEAFVIPTDLAKKSPMHVPHIHTQEELSAIFAGLDQIPYKRNYPVR